MKSLKMKIQSNFKMVNFFSNKLKVLFIEARQNKIDKMAGEFKCSLMVFINKIMRIEI